MGFDIHVDEGIWPLGYLGIVGTIYHDGTLSIEPHSPFASDLRPVQRLNVYGEIQPLAELMAGDRALSPKHSKCAFFLKVKPFLL